MMDCFGPVAGTPVRTAALGGRLRTLMLQLAAGALQPFARLQRWRQNRRDTMMLMRQSDYMLRDIGLGRAEIELAVRGDGGWRRIRGVE